ncbi:non-ribosomal peptide synthetase [Cohnella suwonensis]|uniref:Non-ribosomal peptide synthetase n=1 Tax=Cohnella suwonensis TaxID=696072 RepID=A0ABW0LWN3_9BACL
MSPRTLEERAFERQASNFWNDKLQGWVNEPPVQPDGFGDAIGKNKIEIRIPATAMEDLNLYCRRRDDLRLIFFFAAWATVLSAFAHSEQKRAVAVPAFLGSATGRLVPMMIEKPKTGVSFKEWLGQWLETFRDANRYSEYWHARPDKPLLREGIERFVFTYQTMQGREFENSFAEANGMAVWLHIENDNDNAGEWVGIFSYDAGLYSPVLMRSIAESFVAVLEQASANPDSDMAAWELRSREEITRQASWNDTSEPYDREQTIHGKFKLVTNRYPDQPAVVTPSNRLTYREIDDRSDRLARLLQREGIVAGDRVAVMMDRSAEWVIAFLAVLKAGGVYTPVDPAYPASRIDYMLSDSRSSALIVSGENDTSRRFDGLVIDLANGQTRLHPEEDVMTESQPRLSSKDLAYLLYTSGSTGVPKGVMVEHRGVSNLRRYFEGVLGIGSDERVLQFASASFDASIWELTMALLTGAQLHIAAADVIGDFRKFETLMREQAVTVATLPPTYAVHLNPERMPSLRLLVTAGSESNRELLARWRDRVTYVNAYGPTETTVCATAWNGSKEPLPESAIVPIGRPLPNMQAWIVNDSLQPLPAGLAGELVVAGAGLARGYWNKPDMTDSKFVRLPSDGTRIYRTGDLARWTPEGRLAFLGRLDRQVKIRGYRIETEEVRHALTRQAGVRDAVVTVKPDALGEAVLIGYYTADPEHAPTAEALRESLAGRLPGFMVPAYLIPLPDIPLTPNGKPDMNALPGPSEWLAGKDEPDGEPPRGETENRLAAIWRTLLGVERIGRRDDFFKLGGHSMKAARMTARIHETFGVNMPLEQMFRHSTLAEMADRIGQIGTEPAMPGIPPAPVRSGYRLSPAQTRVFTIESSRPGSALYVLPFAFWLEPAPDFERLEAAFVRLIERHEPLRTSFGWEGGEPVQTVHPAVPFRMDRIRESPERLEDLTGRFARAFALDRPPLLRAALVEFTDGRTMLLLHLHHIIADGISLGILLNDLTAMLSGHELPPLTLQYKDYSEWISGREISAEHDAFWMSRFRDYASTPDLPIDFPRSSSSRRYEGGTLALQWDRAMAESVRRLAARCDATVHLTMLAAYYVLLSKVTGSEDGVIGSLHAGRDHPDLMNMAGMFVHTLAHRNKADGKMTFEAFAREVKRRVAEDYEHADYPYELLVRKLKLRDPSRNPLFDTMFVLQNLEAPLPRGGHTRWIPHVLYEKWSRFDLVFQAWENAEGLLLWVTYSSSLFRETTVGKLAEDYRKLLARLAERPDLVLADLDLATGYRPVTSSRHNLDFRF